MADDKHSKVTEPIHPFHAFLLGGAVPLFVGGLLSDLAYSSNYQTQWNNFAAWLVAGGMVFTGFALLWSLIVLLRRRARPRWLIASAVLLAIAFVVGFVDSFVHARDAYGTMPDGLILSAIVAVAAVAATWTGFSTLRPGKVR